MSVCYFGLTHMPGLRGGGKRYFAKYLVGVMHATKMDPIGSK